MELVNPADVSVLMYPGVYGMMLPIQMMGVFSQIGEGRKRAGAGAAATAAKPVQALAPHGQLCRLRR